MKLKSILILTGLAWAVTLPPALSTSCSSNREYELIIYDHDGITLDKTVRAYQNQDLYIPYTLDTGKRIHTEVSRIYINDTTDLEYRDIGYIGTGKGLWTFDEHNIIIKKTNLTEMRKQNNHITVSIQTL